MNNSILWLEGWPCHPGKPTTSRDGSRGPQTAAVRYTEREVDALLCERVLGWRFYKETRGEYTLATSNYGKDEPWAGVRDPDPERYTAIDAATAGALGFFGSGPPDFAHDIRAAMLLVPALANMGWSMTFWSILLGEGKPFANDWECQFGHSPGRVVACYGSSPSLAIRAAALEALELSMREEETDV